MGRPITSKLKIDATPEEEDQAIFRAAKKARSGLAEEAKDGCHRRLVTS